MDYNREATCNITRSRSMNQSRPMIQSRQVDKVGKLWNAKMQTVSIGYIFLEDQPEEERNKIQDERRVWWGEEEAVSKMEESQDTFIELQGKQDTPFRVST